MDRKKFKEADAKPLALSLDENTLIVAYRNLSACLEAIKIKNPDLFGFIQHRFLHYLKSDCLEQRFSVKKKVDDIGNIIENSIP